MKSDKPFSVGMHRFLEARLSEGQLESQGAFTVLFVELLRKLAAEGDFREENWSFSAVRALVRLGCQGVHLSQFARESWLLGCSAQQLPALVELDSLTLEQILVGQSGLALLARALGGVLATKVAQVCLVGWKDGVTREVLSVHGGSQRPKNFPIIPPHCYTLGIYLRFAGRKYRDLAEELTQAVRHCPVPIVVHSAGWWSASSDLRGRRWLEPGLSL